MFATMPISSVRYLDGFVAGPAPTVDAATVKELIASRLKTVRKERGLTQGQMADELGCSKTSVSFWESKRFLPGRAALQRLHSTFNVDLNWLRQAGQPESDFAARAADPERIRRIFQRIDAIAGSIRIMMIDEVRALIARAIYTADERHEDSFFGLLETRAQKGFTGRAWVMSLEDGRRAELEQAVLPQLAFQGRIKLVRQRLGLSSHAFSTMVGVSQTTWLTWEAGREPGLVGLIRTFGGLDVDLNWLITSPTPRFEAFAADFDWEALLQ